jgi:hypothetical protein
MERIKNIESPPYGNLVEKFRENPVLFLPEQSVISFEGVEKVREESGADLIYACDFNIDGIEPFEKDGYFEWGHVVNIDHHSESPNYRRRISSANLAIQYLKSHSDFLAGSKALTHHTDCDSVLSTAIMSGILPPEDRFGVAAIAADHTGEPNEIADLLQALKDGPDEENTGKNSPERNQGKYLYMLEQLQNFLTGKDLDGKAQRLYEKRLNERQLLKEIVTEGNVKYLGNNGEFACIETEHDNFDPTLLISLLPTAKIILVARQGEDGRTMIGARLGLAMLGSADLRDVMKGAREPFGGRWNAGANKRKGGTSSKVMEVAEKIEAYVRGG